MSNIIKKVSEDIDKYLYLCKKFNEKPQYTKVCRGCLEPDCYGTHAEKLMKMSRERQE